MAAILPPFTPAESPAAPPVAASPRAALRLATAERHQAVDARFARFDLATPEGYRRFLHAMAAAFLPVEAAIEAADAETLLADWPSRRRSAFLRADLAELGLECVAGPAGPSLQDAPAALGAIYVCEGSRLGGAVLRRRVAKGAPTRFLTAPSQPGAWRDLLDALDQRLADPRALACAVDAARIVFACFEAAADHEAAHGGGA